MSFLAKLGQVLATVTGLAPIFPGLFGSGKTAGVVQTGVNDFTSIAQVIVQIEAALKGKPGGEKFIAAVNLVDPSFAHRSLLAARRLQMKPC